MNRVRQFRHREPVVVMPDMRQLNREQLVEIIRLSPADPARWSLRERLAYRELATRPR